MELSDTGHAARLWKRTTIRQTSRQGRDERRCHLTPPKWDEASPGPGLHHVPVKCVRWGAVWAEWAPKGELSPGHAGMTDHRPPDPAPDDQSHRIIHRRSEDAEGSSFTLPPPSHDMCGF